MEKTPFAWFMSLTGEVFREQRGRKTLRFLLDNKAYFIKQHYGTGWAEIFKNLLQGRLPVISAKQEWQGIQRCNELGIATAPLIAYGEKGYNPATRQSFVVTGELAPSISLETLCQEWATTSPQLSFKRALVRQLAEIARTMHQGGVNHRDFYLCHFLLDCAYLAQTKKIKLYLIDLHRMQLRDKVPQRWLIKDLSGLLFSALGLGFSSRDFLRFMKLYTQVNLREAVFSDKRYWCRVMQRAIKLYEKTFPEKVRQGPHKEDLKDLWQYLCELNRHGMPVSSFIF